MATSEQRAHARPHGARRRGRGLERGAESADNEPMRTLTALGATLGIALLLHAPAWAQTLGDLSAAQGVGSSVSAAEASSATTARAMRDTITSHLSSSGGKSAWADAGDAHGQAGSAGAKGWATARSGQGAAAKGWVSARSGGQTAAKGWATADSGKSPSRRR